MNDNQLKVYLTELNSLFDAEGLISHFNQYGSTLLQRFNELTILSIDQLREESNINALTLLAEGIASYGRVVETRGKVVELVPTIFELIESILNKTYNLNQLEILNSQLLRAIGNLNIDLDDHRKLILQTNILEKVVNITNSTNIQSSLFKNSLGCLLNSGMGYEPIRDKICQLITIPKLFDLIFNSNQSLPDDITAFIGLRLISNLSDSDIGFDSIAQNEEKIIELVDLMEKTIKSDNDYKIQMTQILVDLLELIISTKEHIQVIIVNNTRLIPLIALLQFTKQFFTGDKDEDKEILQLRTVLVRVIVGIASHDENLTLFNDEGIMNKLIKWLDDPSDKETCSAGGLFLGNLARTDKNCCELVNKYRVHEKIINILNNVTDLNVIHSVIGLLKNLCLSDDNKPVLYELNIIPLVVPYLEKDSAPPLQYGTVGVLKHLTAKNETNSLSLCQEKNKYCELLPITRLCNLVKRTDNQGIKSEGTRTIINVIKAIYSSPATYDEYGHLLKQNEIINPIIELVKSTKFSILQNEAIIALSLFCMNQKEEAYEILKFYIEDDAEFQGETNVLEQEETNEPKLAAILPLNQAIDTLLNFSRQDYTIQIRFNTLTLCHQLVLNGVNKKDQLGDKYIVFKEKIQETIITFKSSLDNLSNEDDLITRMKSTIDTILNLLSNN